MSEKVLAIVGGGRWGCVTLKVLANMSVPFDRIVIVSKNNTTIVQELINELQPSSLIPLSMVDTLESLVRINKIHAAIVVNAAPEHYLTALELINSGIHVLIEKPITLKTSHTHLLIDAANKNNICLMPGLNYRFCQYLKNFAKVIAQKNQKPISIFLNWADSPNEVRHFDRVTYSDTRTDLAQDYMAHIWAIFTTVFGSTDMSVIDCILSDDRNRVEFLMDLEGVNTRVVIDHRATYRARKLIAKYDNGEEASIDFNIEPGIIFCDGEEFSADLDWNEQSRPLNLQYNHFFEMLGAGKTMEKESRAAIESMKLIENASDLLQQALAAKVELNSCTSK